MGKRNGKRKSRTHKIVNTNHQLDALNEIIIANGISKYDIDLDALFNPTVPLKINRNNLLNAIEQMRRENEGALKQSVKFLAIPFLFVFNSFWMYFEVLCI